MSKYLVLTSSWYLLAYNIKHCPPSSYLICFHFLLMVLFYLFLSNVFNRAALAHKVSVGMINVSGSWSQGFEFNAHLRLPSCAHIYEVKMCSCYPCMLRLLRPKQNFSACGASMVSRLVYKLSFDTICHSVFGT